VPSEAEARAKGAGVGGSNVVPSVESNGRYVEPYGRIGMEGRAPKKASTRPRSAGFGLLQVVARKRSISKMGYPRFLATTHPYAGGAVGASVCK
jgi:hypothetical protein